MGNIIISRILFAGPTCGKSYLRAGHGSEIVDMDDITRKMMPWWFSLRVWAHQPKSEMEVRWQKALRQKQTLLSFVTVANVLLGVERRCLVTNLCGPEVVAAFQYASGHIEVNDSKLQNCVYYWRESAREIAAISKKRDAEKAIPLDMAEKWSSDLKLRPFRHIVLLKHGEHLSDYVSYCPKLKAFRCGLVRQTPIKSSAAKP